MKEWFRLGSAPELMDRLAVRLLLLLTFALLPLGAIAVHTTADAIGAAERRSERALIGLVSDAVAGPRALIESALAAAQALSPLVVERLDNDAECSAMLADYVERSGVFNYAGFIVAEGEPGCRSAPFEWDFASPETYAALSRQPQPTVTFNANAAGTGWPEVIATIPVSTEGALRGFVAVSISALSLELIAPRRNGEWPRYAILINSDGVALDVLRMGDLDSMLPQGEQLGGLVSEGSRVFHGETSYGAPAVFSVAEVIPDRLFALGVWTDTSDPLGERGWFAVPLLFPILMWLASLGVAFFSIYHLVLRHLRHLNRQVRRFALGQREGWPVLADGAPMELRELDSTFRKMSRIIARDEAAREAVLAEKTVLLKEIHHRVKNNLQLIASMINLQMRQLPDQNGIRVLEVIQERVLGLAAIHRSLYEEDRLTRVRADRVLDEILRRIVTSAGNPGLNRMDIDIRLEGLELSGDRMVPLSLLATEAATNAMKYVGHPQDGGRPWVEVTLTVLPEGEVEFRLANSLGVPVSETEGDTSAGQLGSELIEAFSMQLDGELENAEVETPRGQAWVLSVRFRAEDPVEG